MNDLFYRDDACSIRLYHADTVRALDALIEEGERFDMIFADPPYFLSNGGMSVHAGKRVRVDKGSWDVSQGFEHDVRFTSGWIERCKGLLTPNGTIWISGTMHNIHIVGFLLQRLGFVILNDIAWFKPNAPPNLACRSFAHAHETLLWAKRSKQATHTFHYEEMKGWSDSGDPIKHRDRQMRSVWGIPLTPKREKRFGRHPTQKPEALLKRVVRSSTNADDLILDPFCGSGTTGVVAVSEGRRFVGIDNNGDFLAIARQRIAEGIPTTMPLMVD